MVYIVGEASVIRFVMFIKTDYFSKKVARLFADLSDNG